MLIGELTLSDKTPCSFFLLSALQKMSAVSIFLVGLLWQEWSVTVLHLCNRLALYLSPNRSGNNHIKKIGPGAAGRTYSGGKSFSSTLTQHREKVKALVLSNSRAKEKKLSSALYQRRQWRLETAMRKGKTGRALAFLAKSG